MEEWREERKLKREKEHLQRSGGRKKGIEGRKRRREEEGKHRRGKEG